MKKNRPIVWVVMHYEIFDGERADSMQFHVSSSLKAAERYIAKSHVAPYSWWQVHPHRVDHNDRTEGWEGEEVYYYSHTGRRFKKAPVRRALNAYRRSKDKL